MTQRLLGLHLRRLVAQSFGFYMVYENDGHNGYRLHGIYGRIAAHQPDVDLDVAWINAFEHKPTLIPEYERDLDAIISAIRDSYEVDIHIHFPVGVTIRFYPGDSYHDDDHMGGIPAQICRAWLKLVKDNG